MSDELVERLHDACNGHPNAKIPWPHRLLHDAAAELTRLRALNAELADWKARAEVAEVRVKELGAALQDAAETLEWAARRLRDTCASRDDIAAVNLAANRAREARTALY